MKKNYIDEFCNPYYYSNFYLGDVMQVNTSKRHVMYCMSVHSSVEKTPGEEKWNWALYTAPEGCLRMNEFECITTHCSISPPPLQ